MQTHSFWQWAAHTPERTALITPDERTLSFGELGGRVNRIAHGMQSLGLGRGERVALLLPNGQAWIEAYMAATQIGLYVTPINWHLVGEEVAYIVANCDAKLLIAHERYAAAAQQAARAAKLTKKQCLAVGKIEGFRPYEELLAGQPDSPPEERYAGNLMLYTGGTTGKPKGVLRPLPEGGPDQAAQLGQLLFSLFDVKPGRGIHLCQGPLYHSAPAGFSTGAMHMGQTLVLMDKWDAEHALQLIERYRVTATHMVPTMFVRLLRLPEETRRRYDLSSLRNVIHAAAPCPVEIKRQMLDWWGPVIYEYYGATEGGGTLVKPQEWLEHPGTVGRAWPGIQVKILDDDGNELSPNKVGTIYMTAGLGDFEYHKDAEKTRSVKRDGMITAGDLGYLTDEGWLYISDRRTDLILSGGANIYPAEIESILVTHPKVTDAAVFGVPDPDWGEAVQAVIELVDGESGSPQLAEEIRQHAALHLARYKIPRYIDFSEKLPRLPSGKLLKRRLKDQYAGRYKASA
ncbi:MAG: acyl-CoA synthetase [Pseudomonadota bacterium]|nr:acyl-CoA synthetase [Pseudomonadota bacterium]